MSYLYVMFEWSVGVGNSPNVRTGTNVTICNYSMFLKAIKAIDQDREAIINRQLSKY